jgi:polyisoprenoid-binding protein YceI
MVNPEGVMKNFAAILLCIVILSCGRAFAAELYTLDKAHSSVGFSITHMMVSKTTGGFDDMEGLVQFDPNDLANSRFDVTIKAASINTKNEQRDGHLRGADFFEVQKYPLIVFKSKKIVKKSRDSYIVIGDLTMKAVTKEVKLPVKVSGPVKDPMGGGQVLGLESHFIINRQDYGVNWNKALDNGGVVIGNDVDVSVSIEAGKK